MPTPSASEKNLAILYFASLAEQAGKDEETIRFDGDNLTELYQTLSAHWF